MGTRDHAGDPVFHRRIHADLGIEQLLWLVQQRQPTCYSPSHSVAVTRHPKHRCPDDRSWNDHLGSDLSVVEVDGKGDGR